MFSLAISVTTLIILLVVRSKKYYSKRELIKLLELEHALEDPKASPNGNNGARVSKEIRSEIEVLLNRKPEPKALNVAIYVVGAIAAFCFVARLLGIYLP